MFHVEHSKKEEEKRRIVSRETLDINNQTIK
jgi:hypothetical protein